MPAGIGPVTGSAWIVVPKATRPSARGLATVPAVDALQLDPTGPALVESNFTTREVGLPGVSMLFTKSLFAESELSPSGVTRHVKISVSSTRDLRLFYRSALAPQTT